MFQELLVADLVVADLPLENPNVWYELGVRHALRARGVVSSQGSARAGHLPATARLGGPTRSFIGSRSGALPQRAKGVSE